MRFLERSKNFKTILQAQTTRGEGKLSLSWPYLVIERMYPVLGQNPLIMGIYALFFQLKCSFKST